MDILREAGEWYLIFTLVNTVLVGLWYLHLLEVANKTWKKARTLIVLLVAPFWLVIIFTCAALLAAWMCPTKGYGDNYRYYLVATIYGKTSACALYGDRQLEPRKFFRNGFAIFRK